MSAIHWKKWTGNGHHLLDPAWIYVLEGISASRVTIPRSKRRIIHTVFYNIQCPRFGGGEGNDREEYEEDRH